MKGSERAVCFGNMGEGARSKKQEAGREELRARGYRPRALKFQPFRSFPSCSLLFCFLLLARYGCEIFSSTSTISFGLGSFCRFAARARSACAMLPTHSPVSAPTPPRPVILSHNIF